MAFEPWRIGVALLVSYLVGSVPSGWLLVKWIKQVDVRTVGSGNVGATNVTRAAGWRLGLVVFLLDLAKGVIAVWGIAPWLVPATTPAVRLGCGLAAVVGHDFPVFLNFRGGKGVATTFGVLFAAEPLVGLAALAVWTVGFLVWRYVSVGSLAAAVTIPIVQGLRQDPLPVVLLGVGMAFLLVVRHRANIQRLLAGTEHRVSSRDGLAG